MANDKRLGNPVLIPEQQQVEAPSSQLVLPYQFTGESASVVIPNVKNITRLKFKNTAPLTVTNFSNGQEGQELIILGDGQTSVANNANLITGGAHLLNLGEIYRFVLFDNKWYEI